jgi:hypothetical protein
MSGLFSCYAKNEGTKEKTAKKLNSEIRIQDGRLFECRALYSLRFQRCSLPPSSGRKLLPEYMTVIFMLQGGGRFVGTLARGTHA